MFIKKLNLFFFLLTIIGSVFLFYSWYKSNQFKNNPLPQETFQEIKQKQRELEILTYRNFNTKIKFPVLVSDKLPDKLFGATTFGKDSEITIYLNKKHFYESNDYMINDVLPHEYAHALMFSSGNFTKQNGGHTKKWQSICKKLNGLRCNRFVDHDDIIIGKTNVF